MTAGRGVGPPARSSTPLILLAAVSVALGTLVGRSGLLAPAPVTVAGLVLALAAALLIAAARVRFPAGVATGLAAVALLATANAAWRAQAESRALLPSLGRPHLLVEVCGVVAAPGPRSVLVDARTANAGGTSYRIREQVRVAGEGGRPPTLAGDVAAYPSRASSGFGLGGGQQVCARGSVRAPPPAGRGLRASAARAISPRQIPLLLTDEVRVTGTGSALRRAASTVRQRYETAAVAVLPSRQAGLLLGMTDGDTALLDEELLDQFRATGLAHLVAVSGSNVAVVLSIIVLALRVLVRRGRLLRAVLALPALGFFALLTALEPSVLRAVVTAGIVVVATSGGRETDGLRLLGASFSLLVLASPELLLRAGFQLSYAATTGLLLWAGPASRMASRLLAGRPDPGAAATAVGTAVGTTVAAQLAVAPLLALHFGALPAAGAIANLLVAPLAPVVMLGGMATLTAASVTEAAALAPALLRLPLDAILGISSVFSRLPMASVEVDAFGAGALLAGVGFLLIRGRMLAPVAAVTALVLAAASAGAAAARPSCRGPEVRALDVGQGTAVLVRDGSHSVLLDGGPADGRVLDQLEAAGVEHLDVVVASHPHADHVAGLALVLRTMPVGVLIGPPTVGWGEGGQVTSVAQRSGVPVRVLHAGDRLTAGRIVLEALWPPPTDLPEPDEELVNGLSLVLRVRVPGAGVLAPGDLDGPAQLALLGAGQPLEAHVLIAPHHGSKDVDESFIGAVAPRVTLVTVGRDNRYGHPAAEAVAMYESHGTVLRTDRQGTVGVCLAPGRALVRATRGDAGSGTPPGRGSSGGGG